MIKNNTIPIFLLIIIVLLLSIVLTIAFTFAKQIYTTIMSDSAEVAKFDIEISAPYEFDNISAENPFELSFSDIEDWTAFDFVVTNNKQVPVVCTPSFSDPNISFHLFIAAKEYEELYINVGETVKFQVIVVPGGLTIEETFATLILEVEQI